MPERRSNESDAEDKTACRQQYQDYIMSLVERIEFGYPNQSKWTVDSRHVIVSSSLVNTSARTVKSPFSIKLLAILFAHG